MRTSPHFLQCSQLNVAPAFSAHTVNKLITFLAYIKPLTIQCIVSFFVLGHCHDKLVNGLFYVLAVYFRQKTALANHIHWGITSIEITEQGGALTVRPLLSALTA